MSKNYLLEIGVEELPARYIDGACRQIKEKFEGIFEKHNINYEKIQLYSTPRRLTTIISGLDERQKDKEENIKGPSKRISFDEDGEPTKALLGFMRGQKVELEDIIFMEHNGEDYVYAQVLKKGKSIEEILEESVPKLIRTINFPKSMKWGGKNLRFARPIRWIVSLLDDQVLSFDLEGIKVSNATRGHRFLGSSNLIINNIDEYEKVLRENYVLIDPQERKEKIQYASERLAREKGGRLQCDEDLLDEVTHLVEYPTPIIGRIKEEYLSLPMDVVITPMKEHLRYFPVLDSKGRLLPYFITVRNGGEDYIDVVVKGNEKVLGARLEDARFFFNEDISRPLDSYVDELKDIIFQEKLGTVYDKTVRIKKLAKRIAGYLEVGEETKKNVERASQLSKADLVTKMVTEFTELQGKIGMEYANISGENEIVSLAIYEQYLPRFAGDELPSTTAGSILSIADKLDTIAGLFAIGIKPTGSQDPFALRRSALGIINIIIDKRLNLYLNDLIEFALYIYVDEMGLAFNYDRVKKEIRDFFMGRIKNMFADKKVRYDIIEAVLNTDTDNIYDMKIRVDKISQWLEKEDLTEILTAFNRVASLAKEAESNEVTRNLLTEDEIELYNAFNKIEDRVIELIDEKEYDKALDLLATLREPIDKFFDNVMVMVDDEEIRANRLGLLKKIYDIMIQVCDLSKIVNNTSKDKTN